MVDACRGEERKGLVGPRFLPGIHTAGTRRGRYSPYIKGQVPPFTPSPPTQRGWPALYLVQCESHHDGGKVRARDHLAEPAIPDEHARADKEEADGREGQGPLHVKAVALDKELAEDIA